MFKTKWWTGILIGLVLMLLVAAGRAGLAQDHRPDFGQREIERAEQTQDPPVPLPEDCDDVTPPGGTPPACCAYGYVYHEGAPVNGATVHIESAHGELDITTATGGASSNPYYKVNLGAAPLLVSPGEVITVTTDYAGGSTGTAFQAAPDGQQADLVVLDNPLFGDGSGNPLTGYYNLEFRIYDVPTGGTPLWEEFWTGANSVQVSDGLFNVMLGSIDNTLASAIEGHNELYLSITVDTDSEMMPRVQLGSVPFSMQAMTVPDGSVTTAKIADSAVTSAKLNVDNGLTVAGSIVLTGTLDGPTSHWADYRSYIRFLFEDGVTAGDLCPEGGTPVGVVGPKQSLEWTTGDEICEHNTWGTTETECLNVHQIMPCNSIIGNYYPYSAESCSEDFAGMWAPFYWWDAQPMHDVSYNILGAGVGCFAVKYACCINP